MKLFSYGTLMFAEVWRRIGMPQLASQPATLQGYAAFQLRETIIPGIFRSKDDSFVTGLLYDGLDDETFFELDAYESDLYDRITVQVITEDGSEVDCHSYVIPESRRQALSNVPWDPAKFEQHQLVKYLNG